MMMMLWKRVIANQLPLSTLISPLAFAFTVKSPLTFPNFCTQIGSPSTIPLRGVVTEFLMSKCGLSEIESGKISRRDWLRSESIQDLQEVLELLNGCGLTNPAQIRLVVLSNHRFLAGNAKRNIQAKLTLLRTFMREEDICKLLVTSSRIFGSGEDKLKSSISLLQRLGVKGRELSELVATQPRLLSTSEEKVTASFEQVENLGIKKGSKMFAITLRGILGVGKETIDRRLWCLSIAGFSEKQIYELSPWVLKFTEVKLKGKLEFLVKTVGLSLDVVARNPILVGYSLEKRMIPRYRVIEALKSMQKLTTETTFLNIVQLPERLFLEKYVNSNAESSSVLRDIYHGSWKVDH